MKTIQTGLKATKIKNLIVDVEETVDVYPYDKVESNHPVNGYRINIGILNKETGAFNDYFSIERESFPATQHQRTAMKSYQDLMEQKDQLTHDSLDWRRKLGDISAMERQIKAALAKRQIESTKGGKELVRDLIKNFENDLLMLGD